MAHYDGVRPARENKKSGRYEEMQTTNFDKVLGKIKCCTFDFDGDSGVVLGYNIEFLLHGRGCISKSYSSLNNIKSAGHCKWSEQGREGVMVVMLKELSNKVRTVDNLAGIPVEVTIKDSYIKSWRVLTEVL